MLRLREDARGFVNDILQEALKINRLIAGETAKAIKDLANIKLMGSVGVATLGAAGAIVLAPAGALVVSGISLGYGVTCSTIKTWEQGETAKAVGIELGKAALDQELGNFAEGRHVKALADQNKAQQVIRSVEGQIRKNSERLGQEGLRKAQVGKATNIVQRSTVQMAQQQEVVPQASRAATVASVAKVGLTLIFDAYDIWEAFTEYGETTRNL